MGQIHVRNQQYLLPQISRLLERQKPGCAGIQQIQLHLHLYSLYRISDFWSELEATCQFRVDFIQQDFTTTRLYRAHERGSFRLLPFFTEGDRGASGNHGNLVSHEVEQIGWMTERSVQQGIEYVERNRVISTNLLRQFPTVQAG
ncbi:hypothetical protein D3C87_1538940 [compost metagenome]